MSDFETLNLKQNRDLGDKIGSAERAKRFMSGELAVHTLLQDSHDPDIMAAIQPHARRFIKLGQFYQVLEAQGHGQEGPLLVNGRANIAYVLDENGAPWAFVAGWGCGGWGVSVVFSVADRFGWVAGCRVLSQVA